MTAATMPSRTVVFRSLGLLVLVVMALALQVWSADDPALRFGAPASREALAALPAEERLRRTVLDIDRRLEGGGTAHADLAAPARHLHALHHHEGSIGLHGIPSDADLVGLLGEAYAAIGRPELAAVLAQTASTDRGDGEALRLRWLKAWRRDVSVASQIAYLDRHLDDIITAP
jgi:hypothetical protein